MSRSKNKALIFISVILLIANIALLAFFLRPQSSNSQPPAADANKDILAEALQKDVGFDNDQVVQYKQLKDQQWESMRLKFNDVRAAKDSFFHLISVENIPDSLVNAASDVIAQRQKALDLEAFAHFKHVRKLCKTPIQQAKYDSLVQRMFFKMAVSMRRSAAQKNAAPQSK